MKKFKIIFLFNLLNKTSKKHLSSHFSNDLDIFDKKTTSVDLICLIERNSLLIKFLVSFYDNIQITALA
jgi:hypothetical protein